MKQAHTQTSNIIKITKSSKPYQQKKIKINKYIKKREHKPQNK